jgi:hypothetical protein
MAAPVVNNTPRLPAMKIYEGAPLCCGIGGWAVLVQRRVQPPSISYRDPYVLMNSIPKSEESLYSGDFSDLFDEKPSPLWQPRVLPALTWINVKRGTAFEDEFVALLIKHGYKLLRQNKVQRLYYLVHKGGK